MLLMTESAQDKGIFRPQMSAKAAKLALDSLTKRSTSRALSVGSFSFAQVLIFLECCCCLAAGKKTSQLPMGSTRLANILADQWLAQKEAVLHIAEAPSV